MVYLVDSIKIYWIYTKVTLVVSFYIIIVVKSSYLNSIGPETPKGSVPTSYMAKIATNPKPSQVTSYLDNVGAAASISPPSDSQQEYISPTPDAAPSEPVYSAPSSTGKYTRNSNCFE